jgi:cytochrome bd ubiquinol oxidase subunit I
VAALPFVINTAGWMLTENGRQPWIVQGLMKTASGVSPSVSTWWVVTSILTFFLLYAALAVVAWGLIVRYTRRGPDPAEPVGAPASEERVRAMTY